MTQMTTCDLHNATILRLERELAQVKADRDGLQAKVDALMLEYCPSEMNDNQLAEWASHQKVASE
jgi:hypothetical protein